MISGCDSINGRANRKMTAQSKLRDRWETTKDRVSLRAQQQHNSRGEHVKLRMFLCIAIRYVRPGGVDSTCKQRTS
jgi:hypothetical protein